VSVGESPPPAPRHCFGRSELIEKVVKLAENLEPIALIGAGGIGKTSIALAVLHHNRIKERFGDNRRFIRCEQFPASLAHFLARLSEVIGVGVKNPKDLTPLRPSLSSKEMLIVLDNAESILDPQGKNSQEIYPVVEELCQFKTVSLCITSRIVTVPRYCKRPEIPTLSMEAACDIFYGIYGNRGRSGIINDLLQRLDFHALSITLLATIAHQNTWDYGRLAKEWVRVLRTGYNESLAATVELSLASPTFLSLGPTARDLLGVIAFFPQGVDEENLDWLFPTIPNRTNIFDQFCALSLTYRSNGFVTMLAPIRDYLGPQDPQSSSLLCTTRDRYIGRLSIDVDPDEPGFREARWIVSEDVNVEHLLDVFTSVDRSTGEVWDACYRFMEHLRWHKPRQTLLGSKIEALPNDHPSKLKCLFWLSRLSGRAGNYTEETRLLSHTLALERRWGEDSRVARALQRLSLVNRVQHRLKEGIPQAKEAVEIFERIGDTKRQAQSLFELSCLFSDDGQPDAAEDAASRGIELISEKDQGYIFCQLTQALGIAYRLKGEKAKAIHHFETALRIASPPNWRDALFWNHCDLAELFQDEGEFDNTNVHLGQAKSHAGDDPFRLGRSMYMQACVWYQQRRLEEAKSEVSRAVEILERHGAEDGRWQCGDLLQRIERAMESRSTSFPSEFLEVIFRSRQLTSVSWR
jgi:tetratricopeptide (TPR) repeat protein